MGLFTQKSMEGVWKRALFCTVVICGKEVSDLGKIIAGCLKLPKYSWDSWIAQGSRKVDIVGVGGRKVDKGAKRHMSICPMALKEQCKDHPQFKTIGSRNSWLETLCFQS